jgi:hypothetical protein
MLARPLYKIEDFQTLKSEIENIIQKVGFEKNQIICQSLETNPNQWHLGVGSIEELEEKEERRYEKIHDELSGSYLEKIINQHKGFRTRIMLMPPRQCYSIHADPTKRIHIPIITNNQCWMVWPKHSACHQLNVDRAYITDTTQPHTFINGGLEPRIHLVMCIPN